MAAEQTDPRSVDAFVRRYRVCDHQARTHSRTSLESHASDPPESQIGCILNFCVVIRFPGPFALIRIDQVPEDGMSRPKLWCGSYKETPFSSPHLRVVYDGLVDSLEA